MLYTAAYTDFRGLFSFSCMGEHLVYSAAAVLTQQIHLQAELGAREPLSAANEHDGF